MTSKINSTNLPQHIAIIMDGNRRWAKARQLSVDDGHKAGAKILKLLRIIALIWELNI